MLTPIESAIAFESNGIVIGTLDTVPDSTSDFDKDGDVDGDDFLIWQANFGIMDGTATSNSGDATGDGNVDDDDFMAWQSEYLGDPIDPGRVAGPQSNSIPEPGGGGLALLIGGGIVGHVMRRRSPTAGMPSSWQSVPPFERPSAATCQNRLA